MGPPKLATNVLRVGDPVKLTVTVINRSDAPFARLVAPPPPQAREWQVFAATDYAPPQPVPPPRPSPLPIPGPRPQPESMQGVVTFNYTLIPLAETARATPPIPFSCFDPKKGSYADLTIPSVPVIVPPAATPADPHAQAGRRQHAVARRQPAEARQTRPHGCSNGQQPLTAPRVGPGPPPDG